ncbi:TPA: hypothetical protein ACH3X2_008290 [Trebouxia sp. C0005]
MNDHDARETIVKLVAESQGKSGQELDELFETYYSPNVDLDHVALTVRGRENVKKVFVVWGTVAHHAPKVTDVIYDAQQDCAVVYTMQHLTPKLLPFLTFQFPLITKLKFSSGKNKVITHHQDEWTYDGAIMNIPLFGRFFLCTGRRMIGHFWALVGSVLLQ